ncbi:MAG: membrane or secreted protein [Chloroflexota bacterium]|jgi:hypothetical protein|nr:hypothetical protein [Lentimicrobium sp.]
MILKLLLITIVLVGIALAGIAIKMFFIKGGEFKKQCSSVDPTTGRRLGCSCESGGKGACRNDVAKLN